MIGEGLVKGLKITLKRFFAKKITIQYPEEMPNLPSRSHGSFILYPEKCIACGLCVNACPNGVIKLDSFRNEENKKVLENYKMSLGYCLFCGLCVEACPTDAINFKTDFEIAGFSRDDTVFCWAGNAQKKETTAESNTISESAKEE